MDFINSFIASLSSLWLTLSTVSPQAVTSALFIFLSIIFLRWVKLFPTSKWAVYANLIASALLAGLTAGATNAREVSLFVETAGFAALAWKGVSYLREEYFGKPKLFK